MADGEWKGLSKASAGGGAVGDGTEHPEEGMTCFFVGIAAADFVDVDGGSAEDDGFGSHGTRVQSRRYVYQNHVLIVSTPGCPLSPSQTTSLRWGPLFIADEECCGSLHIVHSLDRNMNTIGFLVRRQFGFGRDKSQITNLPESQ